jgi:uncharacterized membrane protein required for colicin V production
MNYISLIIDAALIAVFLVFVFDGRKKGFVKMALSIVATVLSIFVARELCEPVALWVEENMIRQAATNSIANVLSFNMGGNIQNAIDALPAYIVNAAEYAGFSIDSVISGEITLEAIGKAVPQIYSAIKEFAIIPAVKIVAFFVIYLVCNSVLSIAVSFISKIFKLPVLKSFNKLFGGVLGGIKGVFTVLLVSVVLGFATMIVVSEDFVNAVENTYIQQTVWQFLIELVK